MVLNLILQRLLLLVQLPQHTLKKVILRKKEENHLDLVEKYYFFLKKNLRHFKYYRNNIKINIKIK